MNADERTRIDSETIARVGAEFWQTISRTMRLLEGESWAGDDGAELSQVVEGPDAGRLFWRVGDRTFSVEGVTVVETTVGELGRPTRRRVICDSTVLVDELVR